ncbi:ATP phosphoribosyltransferase regulatory subunit [Nitratifractor sp.]
MIFEHEIPAGSRLYFGAGARLKRRIEAKAAELLEARGYEEIVTPIFSYHQHESFDDPMELIRLNDEANHEVSLRADSTADVVRIATKRLGRSTGSKKWFYIQPVYRFPTREQYQIGAEYLEGSIGGVAADAIALLESLEIRPLLQIANIAIPRLLNERYGVALEDLKSMHIERILAAGHPWLERLVYLHRPEELEDLSAYPEDIAAELVRIREAVAGLDYRPLVISPLYYAKLRYYDALIFRLYEENTIFATGGIYRIDGVRAAGFALLTDACIAKIIHKGNA